MILQKAINIGVLASTIGYTLMFLYSQSIVHFPVLDVEYSWPVLFFIAGFITFLIYTHFKEWFHPEYVWQIVTGGVIINYILFKMIEYYLNKE